MGSQNFSPSYGCLFLSAGMVFSSALTVFSSCGGFSYDVDVMVVVVVFFGLIEILLLL